MTVPFMSSGSLSADLLDPLPDESVAVVLGTRPEIVKLSVVIKLLGRRARIVHTGQHYDPAMSELFFGEMRLPCPHVQLDVGGRTRASQIAAALAGLDANFRDNRPHVVIVQGDTNSTVAGALAGNALEVPVVHVEAGLRSFDRCMPEEHNRVVTDHLSDLLCAASPGNVDNLAREGISGGHVVLTGNPIVETVHAQLPPPTARTSVLESRGLRPDGYVVATLHRPENTDDPAVLATILAELGKVRLPVVLPLHPRTAAAVEASHLWHLLDGTVVVEPQGSGTFLSLVRHAALVITDSGGVQEECTVLKRPFIAVRRSTERPESLGDFGVLVDVGELVSKTANMWLDDIGDLHARLSVLPSPYGDGTASQRIVSEMVERLVSR
ncbi:MAG TPA: UDP-N-acetylglucosamine 2-epimerase (non-hydrolyzing) [Actinophytocola sp.]|uniref:non-hydrolyzing UDP-N-acetylglucosamine 2-epimerase n=1 Tax=Actinophytocola sp. TaxID=1872138 RepID=UPI002E021FCB|nr:UDP-N-acetylglucosamine 2-epimerase (non-hydrolyzing) [Actinophytocola sp.]